MNNKKSTKRALLSSVLSLLLCCSMLIGTTFAWFTDEVKSANNIITAGNLDVEVVNKDGDSIADDDVVLFDNILWEPGVVAYENITVQNLGTLALNYALNINFQNENYVVENNLKTEYSLANALKVAIVDGGVQTTLSRDELVGSINAADWTSLYNLKETGELYPANNIPTNVKDAASEKTYGIVIYWQPGENDNNWNVNNGKTTTDGEPLHITLGINLYATQLMYERDSYGDDYDGLALKPAADVKDYITDEKIVWESYGAWSPTYPNDQTLEAIYVFTAPHTAETIGECAYKDWYCDFYVSLDRDLEMSNGVGDLFLGGNYGTWGWIGFENPEAIPANTEIPLLGSVATIPWTYEAIATNVGTFICGVARTYGSNLNKLNGATFTVKLRLTNPDDPTDIVDVSTVQYTFGVNSVEALTQALAAGGEYTVTSNITLDADTTIKVPAGVQATLDLNGYTLSSVSDQTGSNRNMFDVNGGTLTVKNGAITTEHTGDNMGWNNSTNVFNVTAGGVLNIQNATIVNKGGSDMNFCVHLNNWGEVTLNVENSTLSAGYCAVRVFNSGYDMNNVTIKNSTVHCDGNRAFWVHNYSGDNSLLNFNIFGNGNTYIAETDKIGGPIRYGFSDPVYYDANGNVVTA